MKKKYVRADYKIKTLADIYTLYVLVVGIPENTFWNTDIRFLDLIYINKLAWDNYVQNPKER